MSKSKSNLSGIKTGNGNNHGVSIEFADGQVCNLCRKAIAAQPVLYAFVYRGTAAAQSSYNHLGCVRKLKPKVCKTGIDRITGKSLNNKLHYSFKMQNSSPALVKVNVPYIRRLLSLDQTALLTLCLKSPNPKARNALISSISTKLADRLGVSEKKAQLAKKVARTNSNGPLKIKEIAQKLEAKFEEGVCTLNVWESGNVTVEFNLRVTRRKVRVRIRDYSPPVFLQAPSLYKEDWRYRNHVERGVTKSAITTRIRKMVETKAKSFAKHRKLLKLIDEMGIAIALQDDIKTLKSKVLQTALQRYNKKGDISNTSHLIALLVDPDRTIRDLTKAQMQRLLKAKQRKVAKTIDKQGQLATGTQIQHSTSSDITLTNDISQLVS